MTAVELKYLQGAGTLWSLWCGLSLETIKASMHELSSAHKEGGPARQACLDRKGRQCPVSCREACREAACWTGSLPQAHGCLVMVLTRVMMVFTRFMYSCLASGMVKKSS